MYIEDGLSKVKVFWKNDLNKEMFEKEELHFDPVNSEILLNIGYKQIGTNSTFTCLKDNNHKISLLFPSLESKGKNIQHY